MPVLSWIHRYNNPFFLFPTSRDSGLMMTNTQLLEKVKKQTKPAGKFYGAHRDGISVQVANIVRCKILHKWHLCASCKFCEMQNLKRSATHRWKDERRPVGGDPK